MGQLPKCWDKLTRSTTKARLYERETWFREGWYDTCCVSGRQLPKVLQCAALLMIKPDGLTAGKAALIVDFLRTHGFKIAAAETPTLTRLHWREMWRYQMTMATLDRLAVNDLVLCGRALLLVLYHQGLSEVPATVHLSALKGPSDVGRQQPGCLRRLIAQPNRLLSMFHVADEPADLVRELAILLDRPQRRAVLEAVVRGESLSPSSLRRLTIAVRRSVRSPRSTEPSIALGKLEAAIERATSDQGHITAAHRQLILDLGRMRRGKTIAWLAFARAMEAASIKMDTWDLALLGAQFIAYDDAGATRLVNSVSPASWRTSQVPSAGS